MCCIVVYREVKGHSWFEIFWCFFEMESVRGRHNLNTSQLCLHHFTACRCTQRQTKTDAHTEQHNDFIYFRCADVWMFMFQRVLKETHEHNNRIVMFV